MNKFNAMAKLVCNAKNGYVGNEWRIMFQGRQVACVSKNNGKYFAHYIGRVTSLKAHDNFMRAIAEILPVYIELVNADKVASGEEVFSNDKVLAFAGSDVELYIKPVNGTLLQVQGTTFEHLKKYCQNLGDTDTLKVIAEQINSNFNDYAMNLT